MRSTEIRSYPIAALFVRVLFVLLVFGIGAFPVPSTSVFAQDNRVQITGTFHIIWIDHEDGTAEVRYVLVDTLGQWTDLELPDVEPNRPEGFLGQNRKQVKITGVRGADGRSPVRVGYIEELPISGTDAGISAQALVPGANPYVTLLCKFKDLRNYTPKDVSYFQGLMGADFPGMDHYWRELSYDHVNLTGSVVNGWYTMSINSDDPYTLADLTNACVAKADPQVYFPDFSGINFVFNASFSFGGAAWGGSTTLTVDGTTKIYGTTWMSDGAIFQGAFAHEMGHSFGLPHSSGGYGQEYGSYWDVMSSGYVLRFDPVYGYLGNHTISYHKNLLGWIMGQKYIASPNDTQTITLERIAMPSDPGAYLMAEIDIGDGTYYTVEARRFARYDGLGGTLTNGIPLEGIVIHSVSNNRATVVDDNLDGNNNANDASGAWLPGEVFNALGSDQSTISVSVDADTGTGYTVTISRTPPPPSDLAINSLTGPSVASTGETITISDSVMNQGIGDAGSFVVDYYLSNDNIVTTADTRVGYRFMPGLAAGQISTGTTFITLPAAESFTPGDYILGAIVDPLNGIAESDESNNTFTGGPIHISIGPDLVMTQVSGPVSAKTDETISVTATIKNQGTGVANSAPYSIYLSMDTLIDSTDVCLVPFGTSFLAAGASYTFNHNVGIPPSVTAGTYYLGAIAGDSCGISSTIESDENNNTLVGNPVTISEPVVDIAVTGVSGPSRVRRGEFMEVYVTVNNLGPDTANNFRVNIYLSSDAAITSSDTLLTGSQFTLNGGESITFNRTVLVPDSIAKGDYYLGAIGDADNIYLEENETNNSFSGNVVTIR